MELCPQCGAEVEDSGPEGLCGMCLLGGSLVETQLTLAPTAGAATEPHHALEYDSFGHYEILRVLGEGGMGTVYLAQQTAPIRRLVALKVVKLGMDTSLVLSRFDYERQAVAMMDHPNIARVYDASATEKGRPYFVMEYVDGVPITRYCDHHRLNTQERLALFVPVCDAVQHAHQKGVIHRDIKPSNVLVTEQDGRPVAKVIDFGIAKAMDQRGIDNTLLTQLGQFVGTPEYMSPEQADVMTNAVDATSDVYSLGVLLYELLVGAVPFDAATLRKAGVAESLRIIREDEAPALPQKLTGLGKTALEVAERRRTALMALRKELAGDLNWIVMKAVEKTRQRRYASVADMASDIHRHLQCRPVLASPPSRWYRASKFIRRNRLPVLAAAAASAALLAGFAATAWEARIANRERSVAVTQRSRAEAQQALAETRSREAAVEKQRAEEQAAKALRQEQAAERQREIAESRLEDVSALANSMLFEVDDRVRELPGATPAREVLMQRGIEYLNRMSAQTPDDGRLRQQLGAAYLKVGELQWDRTRSNLRDANGARDSYARSVLLLEPQVRANPRNAALRHQLTMAYAGQAALQDSDAEQKAGFARALQSARKLAADEPANPQAEEDLADVYSASGDYRRAVEIWERVVAAGPKAASRRWKLYSAESNLGEALSSFTGPSPQSNLGWELTHKDDQEALDILGKALAGLEALNREEPANAQYQRDRAVTLQRIGLELVWFNRFGEAVGRERQAVAIQTQLAAADPRNAGFRLDLSMMQSGLAFTLYLAGQNAEAIDYMQRALTVQEQQAAEHPENPDFRFQAAVFHYQIGEFAAIGLKDNAGGLKHQRTAESLYRELVRQYPDKRPFVRALAGQLTAVGDTAMAAGDKPAAMEAYREALLDAEGLCAIKDPTDEEWTVRAEAHAGLGRGSDAMGHVDEAIAENRSAIADYQRVIARNPKSVSVQRKLSKSWTDLSGLYGGRSDWKAAVDASLHALPLVEAEYAAAPGDLLATRYLWDVLFRLRNWYTSLGEYDRGIEAAHRCVEIAEKSAALNPGDFRPVGLVGASHVNLGYTWRNAGRRDESLASFRRAAAVLDESPLEKMDSGEMRMHQADSYLFVIRGLRTWEEYAEALPMCRRVLAVLEALQQSEPNNQAYRAELLTAYTAAANAFADNRNYGEALEAERKAMDLETANPLKNAAFWNGQGNRQARIAGMQARTGQDQAALASWREALDLFERSRTEAARVRALHSGDRRSLTDLVTAGQSMAFVLEMLGSRKEALRCLKDAIADQANLADTEPGDPANAQRLREVRGDAVRIEWLIAGEQGDYKSLLSAGDASPALVRAELALGWRRQAAQMSAFLCPMPPRVVASRKAVELDRQTADSEVSSRVDLALDLGQMGWVQLILARHTTGSEREKALHEAREAFVEERGILSSLKQAGTLPAANRADLVTANSRLATVDAKLEEIRLAGQ